MPFVVSQDEGRYSRDASDFIYRMLKKDPKERATATELKQHPFVEGQAGATLNAMLAEASGSS